MTTIVPLDQTVDFTLLYTLTGSLARQYFRSEPGGSTSVLTLLTGAPNPGVSGQNGRSCISVLDTRTGATSPATYAGTQGSPQRWTWTLNVPQSPSDGSYALQFSVKDCGTSVALSAPSTAPYLIDSVAPSITALLPDNGTQTIFSAQPIQAVVQDSGGSGVSTTTSEFTITDVTTGAAQTRLGASYASGTLTSAAASLLDDHDYEVTALVRDRSGNEATFSHLPVASGGGFLKTTTATATSMRAAGSIRPLSCRIVDVSITQKQAVCDNVPLSVGPANVPLGRTRHGGDGSLTQTVPLSSATLRTWIGAAELPATRPADSGASGWTSRTVSQPYEVRSDLAPAATYRAPRVVSDIGTLVADINVAATKVVLEMPESAATQTTAAIVACATPTSSSSGVCTPDPLDRSVIDPARVEINDAVYTTTAATAGQTVTFSAPKLRVQRAPAFIHVPSGVGGVGSVVREVDFANLVGIVTSPSSTSYRREVSVSGVTGKRYAVHNILATGSGVKTFLSDEQNAALSPLSVNLPSDVPPDARVEIHLKNGVAPVVSPCSGCDVFAVRLPAAQIVEIAGSLSSRSSVHNLDEERQLNERTFLSLVSSSGTVTTLPREDTLLSAKPANLGTAVNPAAIVLRTLQVWQERKDPNAIWIDHLLNVYASSGISSGNVTLEGAPGWQVHPNVTAHLGLPENTTQRAFTWQFNSLPATPGGFGPVLNNWVSLPLVKTVGAPCLGACAPASAAFTLNVGGVQVQGTDTEIGNTLVNVPSYGPQTESDVDPRVNLASLSPSVASSLTTVRAGTRLEALAATTTSTKTVRRDCPSNLNDGNGMAGDLRARCSYSEYPEGGDQAHDMHGVELETEAGTFAGVATDAWRSLGKCNAWTMRESYDGFPSLENNCRHHGTETPDISMSAPIQQYGENWGTKWSWIYRENNDGWYEDHYAGPDLGSPYFWFDAAKYSQEFYVSMGSRSTGTSFGSSACVWARIQPMKDSGDGGTCSYWSDGHLP